METKDTLPSCSNSKAQQMQQIQDKAKKSCMLPFQQLHSHLKRLLQNDLKGSRTESGFKRAFATLSGQDTETFTGTMFLNMEQLEKQLDKEDFQVIGSMAAFNVLEKQFQMFITRSGNDALGDDANIIPIYDEEPMAETKDETFAGFRDFSKASITFPVTINFKNLDTFFLTNEAMDYGTSMDYGTGIFKARKIGLTELLAKKATILIILFNLYTIRHQRNHQGVFGDLVQCKAIDHMECPLKEQHIRS
uniref:Uncharacterized protein n=1 Tax=Tanacetum cinerariifolium TaxID=118510 RepID=A0A6L2MWG2_TANCI|nr:hypothetical protein [Tanacetum cinerariifolium]